MLTERLALALEPRLPLSRLREDLFSAWATCDSDGASWLYSRAMYWWMAGMDEPFLSPRVAKACWIRPWVSRLRPMLLAGWQLKELRNLCLLAPGSAVTENPQRTW